MARNDKAASLLLITGAQVLALSLWFAGTASGPGMLREAAAPVSGFQSWLTSSVQGGFVLGTLLSAGLALPDRVDPRRLFAVAAVFGAAVNAAMLVLPVGGAMDLLCRALTGVALACIYPVGMKLAVGWADRADTGLVVGLLVGGLTLGSAAPHLLNALGGVDWRGTVGVASLLALAAAILILRSDLGPRHTAASRFDPAQALLLFRHPGTRLATYGYLGHMWELYAMWAWIGAYLRASFDASGATLNAHQTALATFGVIAAGALGSVLAGRLADRIGRVRVTSLAMAISGLCCLSAGPLFGAAPMLTVALCLVWGVAVVADSAQFSASVAELSPPGLTGTMLTVQTSLGFALTLVSIHLMPVLVAAIGWGGGFAVLAIGPALGIVAMQRLGRNPEAARLAGGRG